MTNPKQAGTSPRRTTKTTPTSATHVGTASPKSAKKPEATLNLPRIALSKAEAAASLGVSVDFLEEHVLHELRVVRRGRRRLIPVRELERWVQDNAARVL